MSESQAPFSLLYMRVLLLPAQAMVVDTHGALLCILTVTSMQTLQFPNNLGTISNLDGLFLDVSVATSGAKPQKGEQTCEGYFFFFF